jgi:hypothetical protein
MKEHQKELIVIPLSSSLDKNLTTAKIVYNNYEIGTCEFQVGPKFPSITPTMGSPFNTQYTYTLIFNKKEDEDKNETSLNIAMNSIQTNGFYKLNGGVFVNLSNLNIPSGIYKNIGMSPEGIRYNLELITNADESKIILNRIC